MTVAKILNWQKAVGDKVETGEILLEIETDKVNYGIESPAGGVVKAILAKVGEEIPVGGLVAIIGRADEEIDVRSYAKETKEAPTPEKAQTDGKKETSFPVLPAAGGRIFASPLARKIAGIKQIDLSRVKGSGRSGRIRMADVEKHILEGKPHKLEPAPSVGPVEVAEVIPLTTMRRTIAQRLAQSFHDAPHFNLCMEVDMTEALRFREENRGQWEAKGVRVSINDILVKAVSQALMEHPEINSSLKGDEIEVYGNVNMGIAVATERGLLVPVLRDADRKSLLDISRESSILIQKTQEGKLGPDDLSFGTFTITNLGTFGIDLFTPIINQPESAILGVGKLDRKVKVVDGDKIAIRSVMNLCLVFDHRVIDGAPAARFLDRVREILESPNQLREMV